MTTDTPWKPRSLGRHGALFVLFGYPVRVQWWFFAGAAILASAAHRDLIGIAVWTVVVGLAVLVHELGHAFAARSLGAFPTIELHGFGGLTRWTAPARVRWSDRLFVSLAGPGAGFLAAGLLIAAERSLGTVSLNFYVRLALSDFWWASIVWGVINLLPVLPLDGGQALHALLQRFSRDSWRWSRIISCAVGGLAAAAFLFAGQAFGAVLFALLAFSAFNQLKGRPAIRIGGLE